VIATASTTRFGHPATLGLTLTLASAVFFSWLGVLTKLAYGAGASVGTVMSGRFLVASAILWPLVWIARARRPARRQVVRGLLLGVGYSAHVWLFSESLVRLDAGLVDLFLFTYPALVTLGAIALRRERWSGRRAAALATATAGTAFVLVGGLGRIDLLGVALALSASVAYTLYILSSAAHLERTEPLVLTALVATGAAGALTVIGVARGDASLHVGSSALAYITILGLVAVAAMSTFIAGIGRLGPSRASIVSAVQPALTPIVGLFVFGDLLTPAQVLGGALVIAGVVILEGRARPAEERAWLARVPRGERRIMRAASALHVGSGTQLMRQGAWAGGFFIIERGQAIVTRNGRVLADLGPGDFFGEIALIGGGRRTASVAAVTDLRVRVIREPEFARTMRMVPTFARAVRGAARERLQPLSFELDVARAAG
jgi:drug/metabolite transporter (DMT)-like permease